MRCRLTFCYFLHGGSIPPISMDKRKGASQEVLFLLDTLDSGIERPERKRDVRPPVGGRTAPSEAGSRKFFAEKLSVTRWSPFAQITDYRSSKRFFVNSTP